jgi:hypothetical protein
VGAVVATRRYRLPGADISGWIGVDIEVAVVNDFIPVRIGIRYGRSAVVDSDCRSSCRHTADDGRP